MAVKLLRGLRLNRVASRMYYRHVHGFASAGKELPEVVYRCIKKAKEFGNHERGDYYEFGIFKGHTFLRAQQSAVRLGLDRMRFFGFDSFAGLPSPEGLDVTANDDFYEGQYACSLNWVRNRLTEHGVDWDSTFLVKGFFDQTLNDDTRQEYGMNKAAVALVDCDLYVSTVCVLSFLRDMMMDKTILIMDDWSTFDADDNRGQRRALREFISANPTWSAEEWFRYGAYGRVFIMHQDAEPVAAPSIPAAE